MNLKQHIHNTVEKYSLNRITRIKYLLREDLEYARTHFSQKHKVKVAQHLDNLDTIAQKMRYLTAWKIVLIVCMYASIVYTIVGDTPLLATAITIARFIGSIVGSTLLFGILLLLNRQTNILISDAHVSSSHIISLITLYRETADMDEPQKKKK